MIVVAVDLVEFKFPGNPAGPTQIYREIYPSHHLRHNYHILEVNVLAVVVFEVFPALLIAVTVMVY